MPMVEMRVAGLSVRRFVPLTPPLDGPLELPMFKCPACPSVFPERALAAEHMLGCAKLAEARRSASGTYAKGA